MTQLPSPKTRHMRIAMNGVTGRVGSEQHLLRAVNAIREEGGLPIGDDVIVIPEPILVGRNQRKLAELSARAGGVAYTTDLEEVLSDSSIDIYFDAQNTGRRFEGVSKAIAAGKHIFCEKPAAASAEQVMNLLRQAEAAGIRHGVVQDKLWAPGLIKLKSLIDTGFFGRIFSVRAEFGYWVFDGNVIPAQRPDWYSLKEEHGGLIIDMFCHWRYLLDNLFGNTRSISCLGAIHIPERWNEAGERYIVTADDSAYATFLLDGGIIAQFNCSFCTRMKSDDILTIQVDGTQGSAIAGLHDCVCQHLGQTPKYVWNAGASVLLNGRTGWLDVPDMGPYPNAFRAQWEYFLRHVERGDPFPWNLREGAKGIQLAEAGLQSWAERRWIDIPDLT